MTTNMKIFNLAIRNLKSHRGDKAACVNMIFEAVQPLCKTETTGYTDETTHLWDWLYEGDYTGKETPTSLAAEWDSLSHD